MDVKRYTFVKFNTGTGFRLNPPRARRRKPPMGRKGRYRRSTPWKSVMPPTAA